MVYTDNFRGPGEPLGRVCVFVCAYSKFWTRWHLTRIFGLTVGYILTPTI